MTRIKKYYIPKDVPISDMDKIKTISPIGQKSNVFALLGFYQQREGNNGTKSE